MEIAIKKRLNNPQISCRLSSHFDPPISYIPVCFSEKKKGFRSVYSATPLLPQSIHPGCCSGPNASPGRSSAVVFPFVLLCCFEVKFCLFSFLFLPLFKASAMFGREGALRLNRVFFFFLLRALAFFPLLMFSCNNSALDRVVTVSFFSCMRWTTEEI